MSAELLYATLAGLNMGLVMFGLLYAMFLDAGVGRRGC